MGECHEWEVEAIDLETGEAHCFDGYRVRELDMPEGWTRFDDVSKATLAARIRELWAEVQELRLKAEW